MGTKLPKLQFKYGHTTTYSNTRNNYQGAQTVAGRRGTLPTFTDSNAYFISSTGVDSAAGTEAAPKASLYGFFMRDTTSGPWDYSGSSRDLSTVGTVPYKNFPCRPLPPMGCSAFAGPFTDSNYFNLPAGLNTALSGLTDFTVEGYIFLEQLNASSGSVIFDLYHASVGAIGYINTNGSIAFNLGGTLLTTDAGLVVTGRWYYIAFTFDSGATNGKKIWLGETPESAVAVKTATQTFTTPTITQSMVGRHASVAGYTFSGYITRLVFSDVARTSFPTVKGTSNILGFYSINLKSVFETTPKDYIVVKDSGTYYEGLYCPWAYEVPAFGIYAADEKAPTFKLARGCTPGTYGAGNAARSVYGDATPDCYVNQTTGNDGTGARGDASKPFKTIQAALTAMTTNGDVVEVQDSGLYVEKLTWPALLEGTVLRAKAGKVPVLRPATTSSTSIHVAAGHNSTSYIDGFVLDGVSSLATLSEGYGGGVFNFINCSITNYGTLSGNLQTSVLTNCAVSRVPKLVISSAAITYGTNNCFDNKLTGSARATYLLGAQSGDYTRCTFRNSTLTYGNNNAKSIFDQCLFENCEMLMAHSVGSSGGFAQYAFTNCKFSESNFKGSCDTLGVTDQTVDLLLYNCQQTGFSGSTYGFWAANTGAGGAGIYRVWMVSCSAFGNARNFYFQLTREYNNTRIYNCTSVAATTAGLDAPSSVDAKYFVDSGSAVTYQSGVVPTTSEYSAALISTEEDTLNVTLSASDAGMFGVPGTELKDLGADCRAWDVVIPGLTIDGLIFEGEKNGEAAVGTSKNSPLTIRFCTFDGLGTYALTLGDASSVSYCDFQTNGHAIKFARASASITYNQALNCGGAFLVNLGQYASLSHNTAWACEFGQYDGAGTANTSVTDSIYSESGVYDYSGPALLSYSCVPTIDPATAATLDAYCTRLNPLFVDPENGDLRLQSLPLGFAYNSPAKGTGSSSSDMGCISYTYGSGSTTSTTLSFATTGYLNPDAIGEEYLGIKVAQDDRENGSFYSRAAAYRKQWTLQWGGNANMPLAQRAAIRAMFATASERVEVSWDGGSTWDWVLLMKGNSLEDDEITKAYTYDDVPRPVRSLTLREE